MLSAARGLGRNMPVDCCWEDAMSNASKNEGRALDRPPNEEEPLRCANEAASKLLICFSGVTSTSIHFK